MQLKGTVASGVGEGKFFMSLEPYKKAMQTQLGYTPYEGTLNIKTDINKAKQFVDNAQEIIIPEFTMGTKKFGAVHCYPCILQNISCAIAVPQYTRYELSTVELISKEYLRGSLNLTDGQEVTIDHENRSS